jgi:hypothetical protein
VNNLQRQIIKANYVSQQQYLFVDVLFQRRKNFEMADSLDIQVFKRESSMNF